jgi:phage baseplate assembly protein W
VAEAADAVATDPTFLGVGWAFPPAPTARGDVAVASYEEDVRQSIHVILGTNPGERLMRPDFGAGLQDLVFEPMGTTLLALVKHRVEHALVVWEPRIDRVEVTVEAEPRAGRLDVGLTYRIRSTNTFYNLVYPFYLVEGGNR